MKKIEEKVWGRVFQKSKHYIRVVYEQPHEMLLPMEPLVMVSYGLTEDCLELERPQNLAVHHN